MKQIKIEKILYPFKNGPTRRNIGKVITGFLTLVFVLNMFDYWTGFFDAKIYGVPIRFVTAVGLFYVTIWTHSKTRGY